MAVATTVALVGAACSDDDSRSGTTPPETAGTDVTDVPITEAASAVDGRLTIGTLLPRSGPGAGLGEPLAAGVKLAVEQINAAGGVNGRRVQLEEGDEGGALATAQRSLEMLADKDVDVLVGPASSRISLGLLADALSNDFTVCSPTNTAISLTRFPDQGRYFRTIPSDALQARALARLIERTGLNAVAIVYIDDEFGEDYRDALTRELESREISVVGSTAFDPDEEELTPAGIRAAAPGAGAIAVIGDPVDGGRMLAALGELDSGDVDYFLNDALRMPNLAAALGGSPGSFLERLQGVAPEADSDDEEFNADFGVRFPNTPIEFAAYAYDCTMLLALAATSAESDEPERIARALIDVSRTGSPCSQFAECKALIDDGRSIDYVGASGNVEIDENGDVGTGSFDIFRFEPSGLDTLDESNIVIS